MLQKGSEIIFERTPLGQQPIVRIKVVPMQAGKMWYLRLIILHGPIQQLDDTAPLTDIYASILTVNGFTHLSFQAAAVAMGIVEDVPLLVCIFKDFEMEGAHHLRLLFANLTVDGYPTLVIYNNVRWQDKMADDLQHPPLIINRIQAQDKLLQILQQLLRSHNRELAEFGLPSPTNSNTELQRERGRHTKNTQQEVSSITCIVNFYSSLSMF
jgi:hypothetical protein